MATKPQPEERLNKQIKVPHTYVIIFFVILFAALLTYMVPVGQYETHEVKYMQGTKEKTKTVLMPETFKIVTDESGAPVKNGVNLFGTEDFGGVLGKGDPGQGVLNYMFEGLTKGDKWGSAVGIVAFILVIGGAFGIILRTGAVDAGIYNVINKTKGAEYVLFPVLFFLFSAGGAIFGMGEEAIPFAMIIVPLVIAMGYDAIVGILLTYGATQIGFATSWMNPFSVAVAQGVSGIPVFSGAPFRMVMWFVFTVFALGYTMLYAMKIKKDPTKSPAYLSDKYYREEFKADETKKAVFQTGHMLVLLTILLGVIWVVYGVVKQGFYIPEIASQFFVMGLVAGVIGVIFKLNNMKVDDIADSFQKGAADLVGAALVVGMAQGIIIVLGGTSADSPTVLNTILHGMGEVVKGMPPAVSAWFMYVFQSCFNFLVVSGSGQAALTMPLMAPLADIIGVTRQVAVVAFQLGDGLTNIIVPTSGCLMGVLGVARLSWTDWAKFQLKMQGFLFLLGSIFVILGVLIGF